MWKRQPDNGPNWFYGWRQIKDVDRKPILLLVEVNLGERTLIVLNGFDLDPDLCIGVFQSADLPELPKSMETRHYPVFKWSR